MKLNLLFSATSSAVFLLPGLIQAQKPENDLVYHYGNYSEMLPQRSYTPEAGRKYNDPQYYSHPDFGMLTFEAPEGKSVAEDLSKRTPYERYYVDLDQPQFFYIEKSSKPINYYQNGYLRAIDASLKQEVTGIYRASSQPCATELNTIQKYSAINLGSQIFEFNHFLLRVVQYDNSVQLLSPDWSHIVVGNYGAYITNAFPGIDMKIIYREASVKSEFIIKQNQHVKQMVFVDQLSTSNQLSVQAEAGMSSDHTKGHILIFDNSQGQQVAQIEPPRTHDNSGSHTSWINTCSLIGNNLEILCDSSILNGTQTLYPVTVDPLVTAVGPIVNGTTYLSGTRVSPAFCSNNISVTYPGGTTPWDVSAGWSIYSNWCFGYYTGHGALSDDCWMSEAQVWVTSSCGGRTPAGALIWTCAGCNNTGNWTPTIAFGSSGTQSLAQCYTASCAAQTQTYTINANRTNCSTYSNYDDCAPTSRSYCQTLDNWRVTVQGRNMETLGNSTTGNGATTVSAICFAGATMNPSVSYGIGALTYNWNPGGDVTSTKTVPTNYTGAQTYTCTVTDACGTVRTAVFTVSTNCVLPVELLDFNGSIVNNHVELGWQTASETNSSHFTVERSYDGINYEFVTMLKAAGNSLEKRSYTSADYQADLNRIIYYRLKQYDNGSSSEQFSQVLSIEPKSSGTVSIFPNPGNGVFELMPAGNYHSMPYQVSVYDITGKELFKQDGLQGANQVDLSSYTNGIYFLRVSLGDEILNWRLVKE